MAKEITVTIHTDITFEATELEKRIIDAIRENLLNDDDFEIYDKLRNKLDDLLLARIHKEMKNLKDVDILDTNWD